MRELKQAIQNFFAKDTGLLYYGGTFVMLAAAVFINYSSSVDIQWAARGDSDLVWFSHYFLLFGGLYYASAILGAKGSEKNYLKNPWFWGFSAAFIILALLPKLHVIPFFSGHSLPEWNSSERIFAFRCRFFLEQFAVAATGLCLMNVLLRKWVQLDIGFRWDRKKLRPYFLILLMVSPLMVIASFFPDFQQAYPQYKPWFRDELAFGLPNGVRIVIFTLCYSTGFIAVELLFRGALSIGMFHIMGTRAVLPMAAFYCAFHFGKPMGEAIASIFGGYLLGILTIHGRSIAGGIIVHLGVAMLMELMGHLQHAFGK